MFISTIINCTFVSVKCKFKFKPKNEMLKILFLNVIQEILFLHSSTRKCFNICTRKDNILLNDFYMFLF